MENRIYKMNQIAYTTNSKEYKMYQNDKPKLTPEFRQVLEDSNKWPEAVVNSVVDFYFEKTGFNRKDELIKGVTFEQYIAQLLIARTHGNLRISGRECLETILQDYCKLSKEAASQYRKIGNTPAIYLPFIAANIHENPAELKRVIEASGTETIWEHTRKAPVKLEIVTESSVAVTDKSAASILGEVMKIREAKDLVEAVELYESFLSR
jgi:hypothetical protein